MTTTNYPTKELTWQIRGNIAIGAGAAPSSETDFYWKLKEVLTGKTGPDWAAITTPWTVVQSCNSVTVSDSGVDLLDTANKFVFSDEDGAHSWIVLQQPITGMQLLISSNYNGVKWFTVSASWVGFTGGTTTANPAAGDAVSLVTSNGQQQPFSNSQGTGFLHVWHSIDGAHTRIAACISSVTTFFATFDKVTAQTGITWTNPSVCSCRYGVDWPSPVVTFNNYKYYANMHCSIGGVLGTLYCTCETWGDQGYPVNFTTAMASTGTWCVAPIPGLWGTSGKYAMPSSAGASALPDILWGCTNIVNGSGYLEPGTGERNWVQLGNFVLPWDNTVIQTA